MVRTYFPSKAVCPHSPVPFVLSSVGRQLRYSRNNEPPLLPLCHLAEVAARSRKPTLDLPTITAFLLPVGANQTEALAGQGPTYCPLAGKWMRMGIQVPTLSALSILGNWAL